MNCLKKIMLSVSLLLMAVSLFAQKDITVSGTVRDEKGETLVGECGCEKPAWIWSGDGSGRKICN